MIETIIISILGVTVVILGFTTFNLLRKNEKQEQKLITEWKSKYHQFEPDTLLQKPEILKLHKSLQQEPIKIDGKIVLTPVSKQTALPKYIIPYIKNKSAPNTFNNLYWRNYSIQVGEMMLFTNF